MSTIVVPQGLGYTGAAVLSTAFLLVWQSYGVVGRARKAAKIDYPQVYAEKAQADASSDAMKFNCAQRAHQNTLEALPYILTTTGITAVQYPILAAAGCGIWSVSRVFYTLGYATGDPKKRQRGAFGVLGVLGLLVGAGKTVFDLISAGV